MSDGKRGVRLGPRHWWDQLREALGLQQSLDSILIAMGDYGRDLNEGVI